MDAPEIFKQALSRFFPNPLSGKDMEAFYISRQDEALAEIKAYLLIEEFPIKFLFSGHMGSGKSTELNRLSTDEEIRKKFLVASFSILDEHDPNNISYQDILISIGSSLFHTAEKLNINLPSGLLTQLEQSQDTIIKTKSVGKKAELSGKAKVSAWFASVQSQLKGDVTIKEEVRTEVTPRLKELLGLIEKIIRGVEEADSLNRKLLVIVDDTDKMQQEAAHDLFYSHGQNLSSPPCSIIYTIPISLMYHESLTSISSNYFTGGAFTLPNIKIRDKAGSVQEEGLALLKSFVEKRLPLKYINPKALEEALFMSGGVLRELARIMRKTCLKAIIRKEEKISLKTVQNVISEFRLEYQRSLTQEDYDLLAKKAKDNRLENNKHMRSLLHYLKLLEYRNGESWCDVNPIIKPLVSPTTITKE